MPDGRQARCPVHPMESRTEPLKHNDLVGRASHQVTVRFSSLIQPQRSCMCIIVNGMTDFQQEVGEKVEEIKPTSIPVDFAKIPDELKRRNLWVVWAYVLKDQRWTKMPFQPVKASQMYRAKTGWSLYVAKSNNPDTWSDYETVAAFHDRHPTLTDGIGVMLQDGLLGDD